mmetsp:Transcript_11772/g.30269  ORF Transcript_11772/g.30269 Transcript_11772/m.30269 type:complete len:97 (-) Transcript_11772:843-1133(-)
MICLEASPAAATASMDAADRPAVRSGLLVDYADSANRDGLNQPRDRLLEGADLRTREELLRAVFEADCKYSHLVSTRPYAMYPEPRFDTQTGERIA